MEIARGLAIQSTIEHPSFLKEKNWLQNNSFKKKLVQQSIFMTERVILINNSTNLKQEKT